MLAIAVEDCNLHHRIALHVLQIVGASPRFLLLGFMLPTAFLSMWISNTAACAMMIPILDAMLGEVLAVSTDSDTDKPKVSPKNMRAMLAMSVCYAANIGGTATTIGKHANITILVPNPSANIVKQFILEIDETGKTSFKDCATVFFCLLHLVVLFLWHIKTKHGEKYESVKTG
jgi:sodium-dependent dicarboxylate transporter 2/3/5